MTLQRFADKDICIYICLVDYANYLISSFQYRVGADGNCTNQVTSCKACYFAREDRPLPDKCSTNHRNYSCAGLTGSDLKECLQTWGKCVNKAFKDVHGKVFGKYNISIICIMLR